MSDISERTQIANTPDNSKQAGILKNALKMAFGTMTSRALGLVRESLLAALFDKPITDAWAAAFRIPNMFRRLLGEGSLSVSFIPIFVEANHDSRERAQNLVNSLYTLLLVMLSVITVLGVLMPDPILHLVLDPEYIANTDKYLITKTMAQIMFGFVFFISSFAFFMGILNALGQFFWPALAPTFWNLAMVVSTLWPKSWLSETSQKNGSQLAWGVLFGGVIQVAVLIPALRKAGYFPKLSFDFRNRDTLRVFKNMGPGLIGLGLLQFTTIVNLRFASSLAEGTISYINYVDRLIELPLSLISVSLGTALLPVLSKYWVQDKKQEMAAQTKHYLELNLFVSIAAACGLFVLAEPIMGLLFGRGRFTANDVHTASLILKTYCWIMVFSSGVRVLTPAYYAIKNTWFPAILAACCLVIHILLAPVFMAKWGVEGLMISTTTSAAVNLVMLLVFYNFLIFDFPYLKFLFSLAKFFGVGLVVIFVAQLHFILVNHMPSHLALAVTIAVVLASFFAIAMRLFPNEFGRLGKQVMGRFLRK
ncbi:murein biosynthesis integral membrane protein MurJ [Bdellovibrio sp. qaytius]|nr:murein biosynthesis integral membrane protein MurJ [Bdellovibrio sp. qaytius]